MVSPQTRSLLSAAISAADHGYFDDARLLLSDALGGEYAMEIAMAIDAIERRDAGCHSLDLRPELRSLFANVHPVSPVESSSVTPIAQQPSVGDDFWSEIVIDFDETSDADDNGAPGETPPFSEAVDSVSDRENETYSEPSQMDRQPSSRARYAAVSPTPPPPSHRRATSSPSTEPGLPRGEDVFSPSASQHSEDQFNTPRSPSSVAVATVAPANRADGGRRDDDVERLARELAPAASTPGPLEEATPLDIAKPVRSGISRLDDELLERALIYQANERDTVVVEAVADSTSDDKQDSARSVGYGSSPVSLFAGVSEPVRSPPSANEQAAYSHGVEPSPSSGSSAKPSIPTVTNLAERGGLSGANTGAENHHEPEFQTDERSARFRVTSSRSASRQALVEGTHRHIHSGIDASDSPPPTREVLGGTLAPRPFDLKAELKLLGRRILKRNLENIQAARASLTPRTMFLIDQIDGQSSVEDIIDVTGLPGQEAYTLIKQLMDQGLVYLD